MGAFLGLEGANFRLKQVDLLDDSFQEMQVSLDIELEIDDSSSFRVDTLYDLCKSALNIEAVGWQNRLENIIQKTVAFYSKTKSIRLVLRVLNPSFEREIKTAVYKIHRHFEKKCPKCSKLFICHNSTYCSCSNIKISSAAAESLKKRYSGCLCMECLKSFA